MTVGGIATGHIVRRKLPAPAVKHAPRLTAAPPIASLLHDKQLRTSKRETAIRLHRAIFAVGLPFLLAADGGAAQAAETCPGLIGWTPPLRLFAIDSAVGQLVTFHSPDLILTEAIGRRPHRAQILDLTRGAAIRPPEASDLIYPKVAPLRGDSIFVVWGEHPDEIGQPTEIWSASYHPGSNAWGASVVLLQSGNGLWWDEHAGSLEYDEATGEVLIFVSDGPRLFLTTYRNGSTRTRLIQEGPLSYLTAVATDPRDGTRWLAWAGLDPNALSQQVPVQEDGAIFVAALGPGQVLGPVDVLEASLDGEVQRPHLEVSDSGVIHVVWAHQIEKRGPLRQAIRHVRSTDGGLTWKTSADLDLQDAFGWVSTVIDGCGDLHLGFQGPRGNTYPYHVRWFDGRWGTPHPLSDAPAGLGLTLQRQGEGLVAYWLSPSPSWVRPPGPVDVYVARTKSPAG